MFVQGKEEGVNMDQAYGKWGISTSEVYYKVESLLRNKMYGECYEKSGGGEETEFSVRGFQKTLQWKLYWTKPWKMDMILTSQYSMGGDTSQKENHEPIWGIYLDLTKIWFWMVVIN